MLIKCYANNYFCIWVSKVSKHLDFASLTQDTYQSYTVAVYAKLVLYFLIITLHVC